VDTRMSKMKILALCSVILTNQSVIYVIYHKFPMAPVSVDSTKRWLSGPETRWSLRGMNDPQTPYRSTLVSD